MGQTENECIQDSNYNETGKKKNLAHDCSRLTKTIQHVSTICETTNRPERVGSPHSHSDSSLLTGILLPFLIMVEPKSFWQATNQNEIAANCFTAYLDPILTYFHLI